MLTLFAITALGQTASEAAVARKRVRFPPVRIDNRVVIRPGTAGTFITELGVQAIRSRLFALDLNLGIAPAANLRLPGNVWWRNMTTVSTGLDLLWEPTAFLSVGPSLNADIRWFRQQGRDIGATVVPNAGLRVNLHVLRGRWYSLAVTLKGMADIVKTDMVLETATIQTLQPVTGQFGIRFNFGHGHYKGEPQ